MKLQLIIEIMSICILFYDFLLIELTDDKSQKTQSNEISFKLNRLKSTKFHSSTLKAHNLLNLTCPKNIIERFYQANWHCNVTHGSGNKYQVNV